jgi:hypothetical protein
MTSKKSQAMKRYSQNPVVTNLKPMKLENVSIEDLCMMELISEERERANLEGHEGRLTLRGDRYQAKITEKMREKKETGKVSTFLTEGTFSTGDVKST